MGLNNPIFSNLIQFFESSWPEKGDTILVYLIFCPIFS